MLHFPFGKKPRNSKNKFLNKLFGYYLKFIMTEGSDGLQAPQIITHIETNLDHSLFDCKWIPCSAKFIVIGSVPRGNGIAEIFEVNSGKAEKIKKFESPNAFKCCTFDASNVIERHLATGDFKGNFEIWDLERASTIYSAKEHTDIINAIDGVGGSMKNCGAPEIVTGSRDGTVKVWDPRQKGKPVANMQPAAGETRRDCWAVGFGNSYNDVERIVVAGYDNGDVKMFDLRAMALRWECNLGNGVCSVEFDRKDIPMNKLVVTTLEDQFHLFDLRTQNPVKGFARLGMKPQEVRGTTWLCRHLPQNRDLFVTSAGTGHLTLWQYTYPPSRSRTVDGATVGVVGEVRRVQRLCVSSQAVNALDWNRDQQGLAVATSFDQHVRLIIVTKLNLY